MIAFYEHMLNQSVDIESFAGLDDSGAPTYGTLVTDVSAYVKRDREVDTGTEGATGDIVTEVFVAREIDEGDRIHLPSGDTMEVMATDTLTSTDGQTAIYTAMGG